MKNSDSIRCTLAILTWRLAKRKKYVRTVGQILSLKEKRLTNCLTICSFSAHGACGESSCNTHTPACITHMAPCPPEHNAQHSKVHIVASKTCTSYVKIVTVRTFAPYSGTLLRVLASNTYVLMCARSSCICRILHWYFGIRFE